MISLSRRTFVFVVWFKFKARHESLWAPAVTGTRKYHGSLFGYTAFISQNTAVFLLYQQYLALFQPTLCLPFATFTHTPGWTTAYFANGPDSVYDSSTFVCFVVTILILGTIPHGALSRRTFWYLLLTEFLLSLLEICCSFSSFDSISVILIATAKPDSEFDDGWLHSDYGWTRRAWRRRKRMG